MRNDALDDQPVGELGVVVSTDANRWRRWPNSSYAPAASPGCAIGRARREGSKRSSSAARTLLSDAFLHRAWPSICSCLIPYVQTCRDFESAEPQNLCNGLLGGSWAPEMPWCGQGSHAPSRHDRRVRMMTGAQEGSPAGDGPAISQVSESLGVPAPTLRSWETAIRSSRSRPGARAAIAAIRQMS